VVGYLSTCYSVCVIVALECQARMRSLLPPSLRTTQLSRTQSWTGGPRTPGQRARKPERQPASGTADCRPRHAPPERPPPPLVTP
jgi:hypothetical protein